MDNEPSLAISNFESAAALAPVLNTNLVGIRQLIRDDGFGQFKVLIQYIGKEVDRLGEILPINTHRNGYPVPMLSSKHADYLGSKYPHINEAEFDRLFF